MHGICNFKDPSRPRVALEYNQQHSIGGPEIWKESLRLKVDKQPLDNPIIIR